MRALCVLFILAQLAVLTGDGRKPVLMPVFSGEVCLAPWPEPLPGLFVAVRFWYARTGDERKRLSEPAGERLVAAFERARIRAHKLGLTFETPRLRQTKPELESELGPGIRYMLAMYYSGSRVIMVNSWWIDRLSDRELEMLLAHEIVHAADYQNERRGNQYLDSFSASDDADDIANTLAGFMFAPGEYWAFMIMLDNSIGQGAER